MNKTKICALEEITYWLKRSGLDQDETDTLLGLFLEQESEFYVECMNLIRHNEETATS